jgi:hypothetical protein
MSGMPWVKVYTDILDDFKMLELEDCQKWRFIQLILVAAECDADGAFVTSDTPVSHKQLSQRLRCDPEILQEDIEIMKELGLLIDDDGILVVAKFGERQGPTQSDKRKAWRERQQKRRDNAKKKKSVTRESPVTPRGVTLKEEEEEIKTISSQKSDKPKTDFVIAMEILEAAFADERGCKLPDWDNGAKEANKRWRTPLGRIYNELDKDIKKAEYIVRSATKKLKKDELTFDAPDQILKTAQSMIINLNSGEAGGLPGYTYVGDE